MRPYSASGLVQTFQYEADGLDGGYRIAGCHCLDYNDGK